MLSVPNIAKDGASVKMIVRGTEHSSDLIGKDLRG